MISILVLTVSPLTKITYVATKCIIGTLNANITVNLILTPKYKDHLYLFKLYQHFCRKEKKRNERSLTLCPKGYKSISIGEC